MPFDGKQPGAVRADEIERFARRNDSLIGDRGDAIEEEIDPAPQSPSSRAKLRRR